MLWGGCKDLLGGSHPYFLLRNIQVLSGLGTFEALKKFLLMHKDKDTHTLQLNLLRLSFKY